METTSQISKRILRIAFPMAGARIINMVSVFVGMIMISRLGHDVLAASALITSSYYTLLVIFMFVLFSVGVVVGRHYGAKEYDTIGDIVQQSFVIALILSIPLFVLYWFLGDILLFFGQKPMLIHYVIAFYHAVAWMVFPMLFATAISQFMFATENVLTVVVATLLGVLAFILSAYAMIFGHWGLPKLGIAGFGYAIVIQEVVLLAYLLIAYTLKKRMHIYRLFDFTRKHDWSLIKTLWRVGWPLSIQFGGELIGFFAITMLIGLIGVNELAAWQVVQQMMMIFVVPIFSFSEASSMVIGHTIGAKEHANISKVNTISTSCAFVFVLIGVLVFILLPKQLAHIYMSHEGGYEQALQPMITTLFLINAFVYFFDSFRHLMTGSLRGLYDTRYAMIVGIIAVWIIAVGFGYILAFPFKLGVYGFSIAQAIAFLIGAIAVWRRWRSRLSSR